MHVTLNSSDQKRDKIQMNISVILTKGCCPDRTVDPHSFNVHLVREASAMWCGSTFSLNTPEVNVVGSQ